MIPLIFGAIALGTAAFGALAGVGGASDISEAQDIVEAAKGSYQQAREIYELTIEETQSLFAEFNKFKVETQSSIVCRYAELKQKIDMSHSALYPQFKEELDTVIAERIQKYRSGEISAEEYFQTMELAFDAIDAIGHIANSGKHQGLLAIGATKIATSVGVASTGTAISGLSGAAAHSAALAWLGGGSLAAGGGGMALGGAILTGLTAAPVLAIIGFTIAGQGADKLKRAIEYHDQIEEEISKLADHLEQLEKLQQQIACQGHLIDNKQVFIHEKMDEFEIALSRSNPNQWNQSHDLEKLQELIREIFRLINQPIAA